MELTLPSLELALPLTEYDDTHIIIENTVDVCLFVM